MQPEAGQDELARMREQARQLELDRLVLGLKTYAEQSHAHRMNALTNVREYGTLSIRSLSLLNGGAIVALLSFTAALFGKSDEKLLMVGINWAHSLRPAFYCFASGLALAGLLSGIAYLNWSAVFQTYHTPAHLSKYIVEGKVEYISPFHIAFANWSTYVALAVGLLSLWAFIVGAWYVADSLQILGA